MKTELTRYRIFVGTIYEIISREVALMEKSEPSKIFLMCHGKFGKFVIKFEPSKFLGSRR